eukprot:TRINITY_DN10057_c0_g1_i3.p1 TRINITY_DN10057_c0_g1~~TRINITY_DN10057_c0_g1_i3.p1  ORF type:complete len:729 (+),score=302.55 TRINITY_DN10057_c0_g1_i3:449-2635(+)
MQGVLEDPEIKGLIPRIVDTIFDRIDQASESMEFTVKASMLEIYNEKIRDLLDPSKNNLNVREEKQRGIYVEGLTEKSVGDNDEVYDIMKQGNDNRAVGSTGMNAQSSRSHSIFHMSIVMNDSDTCACKTGKFYLVDLAGSEMISKTGAKGQTLEEAKGINKSLTMLGRVINALTDGKSQYIPYRDSKLTRILQEALGGNSKTCLIITASPSMYNAVETLSTCRFGMRAKSIKNNAKVNKQLTVAELKIIVMKLEKELAIKNRRILQLEGLIIHLGGTIPPDDENLKALEEPETSTGDKEETEESADAEAIHVEGAEEKKETGAEKGEEKKEAEGTGAKEALPEGVKKQETIIVVGDQIAQQKSEEQIAALKNEKKEINADVDTLFAQLNEERRKIKVKDLNITKLKLQLKNNEEEGEKQKRENELLMKQIAELKSKAPSSSESSETAGNASVLVQKLIDDTSIDPKAKEQIKTVASSMSIQTSSVSLAETHETKKYTTSDMKKIMEEVAVSVKKRHEEERSAMLKKMEELKTANEELKANKQAESENYKFLEGITDEGLKKRVIVLERNVNQLNQMYHQLTNQRATLAIDLQMKDKSIQRKTQRIEELEKQITQLKDDSNVTHLQCDELKSIMKQRLPDAETILTQGIFAQAVHTYAQQAKIVKALRGGGGILWLMSRLEERVHSYWQTSRPQSLTSLINPRNHTLSSIHGVLGLSLIHICRCRRAI